MTTPRELPELPHYAGTTLIAGDSSVQQVFCYTAAQLHAYARQAIAESEARAEGDAKQLDWLIDNSAVIETDGEGNWRAHYEWMPEGYQYGPYAQTPRLAIDAAIAQEAERGEQ